MSMYSQKIGTMKLLELHRNQVFSRTL